MSKVTAPADSGEGQARLAQPPKAESRAQKVHHVTLKTTVFIYMYFNVSCRTWVNFLRDSQPLRELSNFKRETFVTFRI